MNEGGQRRIDVSILEKFLKKCIADKEDSKLIENLRAVIRIAKNMNKKMK